MQVPVAVWSAPGEESRVSSVLMNGGRLAASLPECRRLRVSLQEVAAIEVVIISLFGEVIR